MKYAVIPDSNSEISIISMEIPYQWPGLVSNNSPEQANHLHLLKINRPYKLLKKIENLLKDSKLHMKRRIFVLFAANVQLKFPDIYYTY